MELILPAFVLLLLGYWMLKKAGIVGGSGKIDCAPEAGKVLSDNLEWIERRWARAEKEQEADGRKEFASWYFDDTSNEQKKYLKGLGFKKVPKNLTKGQVSDLIGLFHDAESDEMEMLKFYKVSLRGMNQAKARDALVRIRMDPEKVARWENRSASVMQKECLKFFGQPIPQGLTTERAEQLIGDLEENVGDDAMAEWSGFEDLFDEINDSDIQKEEGIKAVSIKVLRDYTHKLREAGRSLANIDVYAVIEDLKNQHPELER